MLGKWKFVRKQEIECYKGLLETADLQRGFAEEDSERRMRIIRMQISKIRGLQEDVRATGITDHEAEILVEIRAYLVVVKEFVDRGEESRGANASSTEASRLLSDARSKFTDGSAALVQLIQEAL